MVWRNSNDRMRRRLPSVPWEQKIVRPLTQLNLQDMPSTIVPMGNAVERPSSSTVADDGDDCNGTNLFLAQCSQQSRTTIFRSQSPVHSNQRRELPTEENFEICDMISSRSPISKSAERRTEQEVFPDEDYSYVNERSTTMKSSLEKRRSAADFLRRHCSMSFDSSCPLKSTNQSSSRNWLVKPRSVIALQKKSDSFKKNEMSYDDQKKGKGSPSPATSNLSLTSKVGSQNSNKKVTRRPHSTDVSKSSQAAVSSSSCSKKNDRLAATSLSSTKPPSLSSNSQSIILFCMENARSDIALRIVQRMAHKRDDFAQFYANLSIEQSNELIVTLKKFLSDVVQNIANSEKIRQISREYGIEQAHKRNWGFKADFFSVLADALTTECVFLDSAAHQPTETIEAWATLVELMFTSVRDGYYKETRLLRRNWYDFHSQSNLSSNSDRSLEIDLLHSAPALDHMSTAV